MRRLTLLLVLLASFPLFAAHYELVPPAPTERTPVTVQVRSTWRDGCLPRNAVVTRTGSRIEVTWTIPSGGGCPLAVTPWNDDVPLGTLAPGLYEVTLRVNDGGTMRVLATRSLEVLESAPAFTVEPRIVSSNAPTEVRIVREVLFCPNQSVAVLVDGVSVPVRRAQCELFATVPARAPGTANVRLVLDGQSIDAAAALRYIDPAAAPDPALYERVLVPVLYEGPGAFGSQWATEAVMINATDTPLESLPDVARPLPRVAARQSVSLFPLFGNRASGLLLFIPRGRDVRFGNLVRDLSRDTQQWGSEVPVVREEDARLEVYLPNVPFDPNYRLQLRVYGLEGVPMQVEVAVQGQGFVPQQALQLSAPCATAPCNSNQPAYASADLRQLFPRLTGGRATIQVRPASHEEHDRMWAFVTVTNNTTQAVTVISPQ